MEDFGESEISVCNNDYNARKIDMSGVSLLDQLASDIDDEDAKQNNENNQQKSSVFGKYNFVNAQKSNLKKESIQIKPESCNQNLETFQQKLES